MRSPVDLDRVAAVMTEAAERTILPRFRALAADEVRAKSRQDDLVTVADLDCQKFLADRFGPMLSGAGFVGEESGDSEAAARARIRASEWCWILDPIDGTYNFVQGKPGFSIMAALTHRGETMAAWIHEPLSGRTVCAARGRGARCGDAALRVAESAAIGAMRGAFYIGVRRAPDLHARIAALSGRLGPRSFQRGAGAEYLDLAGGNLHYAIFTRLLPWDHAAGALIATEAGGHAALLDGSPYRPGDEFSHPLLLAPNERSWRELQALFAPREG
jgi:fructose-1,6-bisphosphatase/inositol monophosphatase family enzyme